MARGGKRGKVEGGKSSSRKTVRKKEMLKGVRGLFSKENIPEVHRLSCRLGSQSTREKLLE